MSPPLDGNGVTPTPSLNGIALADERAAWENGASALAAWTIKHLANRLDVFGHYVAVEARETKGMQQFTDKHPVTLAVLENHYRAASTGDLIGLHTTSYHAELDGELDACRSLWGAIDLDVHDDAAHPDASAEANLKFALAIYEQARQLGLSVLLTTSNGRGGLHLRILFDRPVPTEFVYRILKWFVANWQECGLEQEPEVFPKQTHIKADQYGNWLRLFGRHHTHDHYSQVWNGERWLAGSDAIMAILSTQGASIDCVPEELLVPPVLESKPAIPPSRNASSANGQDERPGDAFNEQASWDDILVGWTRLFTRGDITYWRRPGKTAGVSATTFGESGLFYPFTTSTAFEAGRSYTRFGAYAHLNHGADHAEAAKALGRLGYGSSPNGCGGKGRPQTIDAVWMRTATGNGALPKADRQASVPMKPLDLDAIQKRIDRVKDADSLAELYQDTALLVALCRLRKEHPAQYAAILVRLRKIKFFKIKEFDRAIAANRPAKSKAAANPERNGAPPEGKEAPANQEHDWEADAEDGALEASRQQAERSIFANYEEETKEGLDGEPIKVKNPYMIHDLHRAVINLSGNWPKRVEDRLFISTADYEPVFLDSPQKMFAWIDKQSRVAWTRGERFITQERFYEHLCMNVDRFDAIETLPHFPEIPGIYYLHPPLPSPTKGTAALQKFVDFFNPSTDIDRELILAMILTVFWGGAPGRRPAFLVTGESDGTGTVDAMMDRGIGKTTLLDIIADELAGGFIDVSPTDEIGDIKTRLLSKTALRTRIARLDNLKRLKFSWADLEGLITSSEISGRALYQGEGRRPNTLIWIITLNGASLSKDMAQRVVPIRLKRPTFAATWEQEVRAYAQANRWQIIADIEATLQDEPGVFQPRTRWATWEQEVLSKVDKPAECQNLIAERQELIDEDDEEKLTVADLFRVQITSAGHNPTTDHVFIPSAVAARWVSIATRKSWATNTASAYIRGLGIPELRKTKGGDERGWHWVGEQGKFDDGAKKRIIDDVWSQTATGGSRESKEARCASDPF